MFDLFPSTSSGGDVPSLGAKIHVIFTNLKEMYENIGNVERELGFSYQGTVLITSLI